MKYTRLILREQVAVVEGTKMKYVTLTAIYVITRALLLIFVFPQPVADFMYFISTDLLIIGFLLYLSFNRSSIVRAIMCAGLFYQISMTVIDILLLLNIGSVHSWYYTAPLMLSIVIGFIYGGISKHS